MRPFHTIVTPVNLGWMRASTRKCARSFPCGLQQKSIFQGCMTVVCRNQRSSSINSLFVSIRPGLSPSFCFYLLIKTVRAIKGRNNSAFTSIYSILLFLCVWAQLFFTSICKTREILLCSVRFTGHLLSVWLLSVFKVSPSFTLSSAKLPLTLFGFRRPPCPSVCVCVWMCCVFCIFFVCVCVWRLCALRRMQREGGQKQQPWHMKTRPENVRLPANIVPTLSHVHMSNVHCFVITLSFLRLDESQSDCCHICIWYCCF